MRVNVIARECVGGLQRGEMLSLANVDGGDGEGRGHALEHLAFVEFHPLRRRAVPLEPGQIPGAATKNMLWDGKDAVV